MKPDVGERIHRLEEIATRDVGRGIAPLAAAARGGLLGAARSIAEHGESHVAVLTGFYIPAAEPPAPETDGPVGAAQLAAALTRAGFPVRLVTDERCAGAVRAAARAAGCGEAPLDVLAVGGHGGVGNVLDAWDTAVPTVSHVVAIERVGPAADGVCRNMRGEDVTPFTAPADRLFQPPRIRIGIGDGGNELGMGSLPRELVAESIPRGERIACTVACDHLLVCGISNWGANALVAALALLWDDRREALLDGLTEDVEREVLRATVEEGPAVDGVLRRQALSVDGLEWDEHARVLRRLRDVVDG